MPVLGNSAQSTLNLMSSGAFALACVGIAFLALAAPRRPRLPQLCFLLLAAFLILNKVWSPQYVIWLVPLAVLARPRVWPYVLWQLAEVAYFFGIWGYFVNMYQPPAGVTGGWYFVILGGPAAVGRPGRPVTIVLRHRCARKRTGSGRPASTTTRPAASSTARPTAWSSSGAATASASRPRPPRTDSGRPGS